MSLHISGMIRGRFRAWLKLESGSKENKPRSGETGTGGFKDSHVAMSLNNYTGIIERQGFDQRFERWSLWYRARISTIDTVAEGRRGREEVRQRGRHVWKERTREREREREREVWREKDRSLKILSIAPNRRSRAHVWRPLPLLIKRTRDS